VELRLIKNRCLKNVGAPQCTDQMSKGGDDLGCDSLQKMFVDIVNRRVGMDIHTIACFGQMAETLGGWEITDIQCGA